MLFAFIFCTGGLGVLDWAGGQPLGRIQLGSNTMIMFMLAVGGGVACTGDGK